MRRCCSNKRNTANAANAACTANANATANATDADDTDTADAADTDTDTDTIECPSEKRQHHSDGHTGLYETRTDVSVEAQIRPRKRDQQNGYMAKSQPGDRVR